MDIHIPDEQYALLAERAAGAGYPSVDAWIVSLVASADVPVNGSEDAAIEAKGSMSEQQLRESAAASDQAIRDMKAGGGRDAHRALEEIARQRGFSLPQ